MGLILKHGIAIAYPATGFLRPPEQTGFFRFVDNIVHGFMTVERIKIQRVMIGIRSHADISCLYDDV